MSHLARYLRFAAPLLLLASAAPMVHAQSAEDTIELARSFIGKDRDLDAIKSVRFTGSIKDDQGASGTIDIIFQKPLFHRIEITVGGTKDVKALDDYEAWSQVRNQEGQWRFRVLDASEVSRLRAIVWENLAFYRGIERLGGKVVIDGRETVDGIECTKAVFSHPNGTNFTRFFDRKTGRLVMTRTDDNTEIREEGEVREGNVRFPKSVVTSAKTMRVPEGGGDPVSTVVKTTITFDKIVVNEDYPRMTFATPLFTGM